MDGTASDAFNRNFDIYPETGVFGYVHCGTAVPTLVVTQPGPANAKADQEVTVEVTTTVPISRVWMVIEDDPIDLYVPDFVTYNPSGVTNFSTEQNLARGSNGVPDGLVGGSPQEWTAVYAADDTIDPDKKNNVPHDIHFYAKDI